MQNKTDFVWFMHSKVTVKDMLSLTQTFVDVYLWQWQTSHELLFDLAVVGGEHGVWMVVMANTPIF